VRRRQFRVQIPIRAIETLSDGTGVPITIPPESEIDVLSEEDEDRMVRVLFGGRQLRIFAVDVQERCDEIMTWATVAEPR
jgi:hypothetical protein